MKDKASDKNNLEHLLRNKLESIREQPDSGTWEKIATQQAPKNTWLKIRHYGLYALPVVLLLLAGFGWWQFNHSPEQPTQVPDKIAPVPTQPSEPPVPVATLDQPAPEPASNQSSYSVPASVQRLNTVPASTVRFEAKSGLDYESPITGTRVHIPANVLVNSKGQPAQGTAELMIREYRDIADFLASGIPMHYADGRGDFFFNSGGMFEVRVSQLGEMLSVAPGMSFDVEFTATGALENASLYYFDEQTGAWRYQPDPAFDSPRLSSARMPNGPPVVAEAVAVRNNRQNNDQPCLPLMPELPVTADPGVWVSAGVRTGHDLATQKMKMPAWFRQNPNLTSEALLNGTERGMVRIVRNQDLGELFFPEDMNNFFTELKAFKDCYFIRSTDSVSSTLGPAQIPDIYWDRVTVRQELGNEVWISLYSDTEGLVQFYANLTASIGNKQFEADKVMAEYRRLRDQRLKDFEATVNSLHQFLATAAMFQTEPEWCMSYPEWIAYFDAQLPMMAKRYAALVQTGLDRDQVLAQNAWNKWRTRARNMYLDRAEAAQKFARNPAGGKVEAMRYALKVSQFGTYNCDQIFRLGGTPDYIYATYQTETGDRVYATSVSVLEKNSRLFFTLPAADKMLRVPGRALDVVITDKEGRQYHLPGDVYARLDLKSRQVNNFVVKDITEKTRSPRDWANYLDM
ncbi:MAG: hypothetical protein H6574_03970 [Lewinellaceae bacterium]|nr:hypothetical protein [Saprospiraceae bacterium]MCB9330217.1 hypothetical protein [Lewinellaceae bacterium]